MDDAVNVRRMNMTYMKIFTLRLGLARAEHAATCADATRMSRGRWELPA
jgi:hypothetical protein